MKPVSIRVLTQRPICLLFCIALAVTLIPIIQCAPSSPAITPVEPPKHIATTAPLAPAKHEQVNLNLLAAPMGTSSYVLNFALADLLNKNHPWIRAQAIETQGFGENTMLLAAEPDRRNNTIVGNTIITVYLAKMGLPPFKTAYPSLKAVAQWGHGVAFFTSLDKDIKTVRDFVGKRIALGPKGSTNEIFPSLVLEYGYGIKDKIKLEYMDWNKAKAALVDGLVDVAFQSTSSADPWILLPSVQELAATKDPVFISTDESAIALASQKSGLPLSGRLIPAGILSRSQEPVYGLVYPNGWFADQSLSAETVYEVTRIICENASKFGEYHAIGKGVKPDNLGYFPLTESDFHPGAVKLYKEKGIVIGQQ